MDNEKSQSDFRPMDASDELRLLAQDDASFSRTHLYLQPLIDRALTRINVDSNKHSQLRAEILSRVPLAATRFLSNPQKNIGISFAVYFTWYIHDAIENR